MWANLAQNMPRYRSVGDDWHLGVTLCGTSMTGSAPLPGSFQSVWVFAPLRVCFGWCTTDPEDHFYRPCHHTGGLPGCSLPVSRSCQDPASPRPASTTPLLLHHTQRAPLRALRNGASQNGRALPMTEISFTHSHMAGWWHGDILTTQITEISFIM